MTAPIAPKPIGGPAVTDKTLRNPGGGNAAPGYLQVRTPMMNQQGTQPVVTPKSTVVPGEVGKTLQNIPQMPQRSMPQAPQAPQGPPVTPAGQPPAPPQAGGNNLQGLYNFFASDLQNQAKQAASNSIADASARGVYYGTPLTGSEADINTQYLRGLGQLQAGMYGNEQQNQLARLGLATQLAGMSGFNAPPSGQIDPNTYAMLGQLFGGGAGGTGSTPVAGARSGPAITPKMGAGDKTQQPQQTTN